MGQLGMALDEASLTKLRVGLRKCLSSFPSSVRNTGGLFWKKERKAWHS